MPFQYHLSNTAKSDYTYVVRNAFIAPGRNMERQAMFN